MKFKWTFSYKPKIIPLGPTCGQDTYKERVGQRRKKVVEDLNVSLTTKYKLQPAEYSPPSTLLRPNNENLSAISGPALPSGPNLHLRNPESPKKVIKEDDIIKSSSEDEDSELEESTLSYSSFNYSAVPQVSKGGGGMNALIKPKERLGQSIQAKTITSSSNI